MHTNVSRTEEHEFIFYKNSCLICGKFVFIRGSKFVYIRGSKFVFIRGEK